MPVVGVLALQGDFEAHARMLEALGADVREVRVPADLDGLDGLVIPGGESTTMTLGIEREGLAEPLRALVRSGTPVLGTCAGMILLDRDHLGLMDTVCERNAFGRQVRSFESDLDIPGIDGPVRAVFIRAPWLAEAGAGVEILASVDGHGVAARQDNMLVISFHPEIAGENRVHALFLRDVRAASRTGRGVIYFTRHGESVANVADREARPAPEDADRLSERGWAQARGVGERLKGEGIEAIVASPFGRAQETGQAIGEVLGLEVETDEDLYEVRQSDAYRAASPEYEGTGHISWMPLSPPGHAERGAESFEDIAGRVARVQERLQERSDRERVLCVSHWGFLHFFLGAALFREDFAPAHLPALYRISHANTGITIFERRVDYRIEGVAFDGWALLTWNDQGHL